MHGIGWYLCSSLDSSDPYPQLHVPSPSQPPKASTQLEFPHVGPQPVLGNHDTAIHLRPLNYLPLTVHSFSASASIESFLLPGGLSEHYRHLLSSASRLNTCSTGSRAPICMSIALLLWFSLTWIGKCTFFFDRGSSLQLLHVDSQMRQDAGS